MSTLDLSTSLSITGTWLDLRSVVARKSLRLQFTESDDRYEPFAIDGPLVYSTIIFKGLIGAGSLRQEDNDAYKLDFESNHKPTANRPLAYEDRPFVDLANYPDSNAPGKAILSIDAASYATLGGLFQFDAIAGIETDYPLFAYPAGFSERLFIEGVKIDAFVLGAPISGTSTTLEWGLGVNGGQPILGGAPPLPQRLPLGSMNAQVGAPIGTVFQNPIDRSFTAALISSTFLHVILRVPISTATPGQVIRGQVVIKGYLR